MNIKEIKEMINLMNENGLVELEIEKDGMRVRLKKTVSGTEVFSGPVVSEREKISMRNKALFHGEFDSLYRTFDRR